MTVLALAFGLALSIIAYRVGWHAGNRCGVIAGRRDVS